MAGEAEWEALPDVVPAEPQAPAAEWESLPDVVAPEKVQEFPEVDLTVNPAVESRNAVLRTAFELTKKKQGPELARATELARTFGVPVTAVLPNLPQFEYAVESSNFDPDEFYKKNKALVDAMAGDPEKISTVIASPTVGPLIESLRKAEDLGLIAALNQATQDVLNPASGALRVGKRIVDQVSGTDVMARDAAEAAAADAETQKKRAGKISMQDNPEAKAIREADGLMGLERTALTVQQRYREGRASTSMGYAGFDYMLAKARGADPEKVAEAAAEVQNLRAAATPLYLAESENQRIAGDAIQGMISTADGLLARGVTAGVGAVVAGAAAGLATKSVAGVEAGAEFGAKQGARLGGAYHGFKAEAGSKFLELEDAVTDDGHRLTTEEALGGAVAYGLVAGYLETMGFEAQAAPMKAGIARMMGNPLFRRRLVDIGKEWVKGAATEGVTEGLQAAASDLFEYVVKSEKDWKLQKGPIVNLENVAREGQAGGLSALFIGGGGAVFHAAVEGVKKDQQAVTGPEQLKIIIALANDEAVKSAPKEFADVVAKATAESGAPVREFWVEASEAQRLHQEAGQTEEQFELALGEAAGPAAVSEYKAALAEGGRFSIPLERVLTSWGASEMGQQLIQHTSTTETGATPSQVTAELEAIRAHAMEMAKQAMAVQQDEDSFDESMTTMLRDIKESGASAGALRAARDGVRIIRAVYETAKEDRPDLTWKQFVESAGLLKFAEGDNGGATKVTAIDAATDLRDVIDFGGENKTPLSTTQKAEMLFRDDVSGLRTEEGWTLQPAPKGYMVGQATTPDAKSVNDNPDGSHDATNALLARMAAVVARHDPRAARVGPNFWFHVKDQQALDALQADLQAAMPAGMQAFAAMAPTREAAGQALDKKVNDGRKAGLIPPRGGTNYKGPLHDLNAGVAKVTTPLESAHTSAVEAEGNYDTREKFGSRAFLDKTVPGLLSRLGFLMSRPAKFVASIDLRGLRDVNIELGKRVGDAIIKVFSDRLVAMGGSAFAAAHMSGDEFALKHDSKEAVLEMLADLRDDLAEVKVDIDPAEVEVRTAEDVADVARQTGEKTKGRVMFGEDVVEFIGGQQLRAIFESRPPAIDVKIQLDAESVTGLKFRWGLGESTYGAADRDLNARKRDEAAGQAAPQDVDGGVPAGQARDDLRERRAAPLDRRARAEARGVARANPFVDVSAAAQGDEVAFDFGEDLGVGKPAGEPLAPLDRIEAARAAVARKNRKTAEEKARVARFEAFLSYVEGKTARPKETPDPTRAGSPLTSGGLWRDEQLEMLRSYGIDDPVGTFATSALMSENPDEYHARGEKQARRGEGDRSAAARNESRMADANRARGKLVPDAQGRLLRQSDVTSAPAVSPHRLADGRSIVFDTSGDTTKVAAIDVEGLRTLLENLNKSFQEVPVPLWPGSLYVLELKKERDRDVRSAMRDVAEGRIDAARVTLRRLQDAEADVNDVDVEVETPAEWGSKLESFIQALDRALSVTEAKNDFGGGLGLNPEDTNTLMVALDEFESQTGRLYQSEQTSARVLSDGRRVVVGNFDTQRDGKAVMESRVSLVDVEAIKRTLDKVREKYRGVPEGAAAEDRQTESFYAGLRDEMIVGLEGAIAAVEAGDVDQAVTLMGKAFDAEGRWLPPGQMLGSLLGDALDALGKDASMSEVREGNPFDLSEATQQEVLVALDEYEAATGRMQQDETADSTPRGYFERPPPGAAGVQRVLRVFLNRKADASTVMHEAAHGFLEMLHNLASDEKAGARTKQQWADAMKWLGVEKYSDIKRDHHERWARAFEAYLREGKAPSEALWGAFGRFKSWLSRIYKSVTQLNVELDDDIRRVFDRLLATDEEIARANGRRGEGPWGSAEEAGMTAEQWADYQAEQREALDFATRDARARFMKDQLRAKEWDWKQQVEEARADAEKEFESLPGRKAQRFLEGKAEDLLDADVSMEPWVLDRTAVERAVGAAGAKKLRTRKVGGQNPDDAAGFTGFPTGKEMLQAITSLPEKSAWVEQRAQALVEERDSAGAAELEQLRKEVAGGVQDYVEKRMAREWAELGRRAEPGDDVSELGRQVALMALKRAAKMVIDQTRVRSLNPNKVLKRERDAAKKVRNAARTGDMDAARDWFREQTLQVFAHGHTLDAQEEVARFEKLATMMAKTETRAKIGKASPQLRDAVDYLLGSFNLGPETDFTGQTLVDAAAVLEESGQIPGEWLAELRTPELIGSGDWKNLSMTGLRHVNAALLQLMEEARFRNEVILGEQRADRAAIKAEMLREMVEVLPARPPVGTSTSDSALEKLAADANGIDGFLLNPADLVRDLTGDNINSTWWKAVVEPLRNAKYKEAELLKRAVEPVVKAIEDLPESLRARAREKVDGRKMFPTHIENLVPRERHELLMMALNVGNLGNLQRLTDGRGITVEQVARALDTLTDEELRWVQSVWDAIESLKADAFALEERVTGLRPQGVEAVPFRLASGRTLRGGYFPAVYDRRASVLGEKQALGQVAQLMDPRWVPPGTPHGHLKQRMERVEDAALSLDINIIYRHLAQAAHDIAFREAVKSVGSLVLDNDIQRELRSRLGEGKTRTFLKWLKDVGGGSNVEVSVGDEKLAKFRGALSHVLLGWSTATAFGDFANLAASVASTPLKAMHLADGMRRFAKAPFQQRALAMEASPWLRTMDDTIRRQFDTALKTMLTKQLPKPLQWYKDNAFALMEAVSFMTATPVWLGAHQQALDEGASPADAVKFADDILSRVFPSHSPVDQAGILRDKGFWGKSTLFYGYLSVAYRAQHRLVMPLFDQEFASASATGKAATVATVAGRLLGFYIAFGALGELLMGRGAEPGDDDKDHPGDHARRWRNWFVRKLVSAPLSTVPGPFSAMWESKMLGKPAASSRTSPVSALFEMMGKQLATALDTEKEPDERFFAVLKMFLESQGMPVAPFDRQGRWLYNVTVGNSAPGDVGDVLSGAMYGERKNQPANLFRPRGGE